MTASKDRALALLYGCFQSHLPLPFLARAVLFRGAHTSPSVPPVQLVFGFFAAIRNPRAFNLRATVYPALRPCESGAPAIVVASGWVVTGTAVIDPPGITVRFPSATAYDCPHSLRTPFLKGTHPEPLCPRPPPCFQH